MDFKSDRLFDGRPFRIVRVVDCHTREPLSLTPRANFRAFQVTEALDALVKLRSRPIVQRPPTGGMSERLVVPVAGRCSRAHRGLEVPLQRRSAPYGPGRLDAPGLRQPSCHSPRNCIGCGPQTGSTPDQPCTNFDLRPPRGGRSDRARAEAELERRQGATRWHLAGGQRLSASDARGRRDGGHPPSAAARHLARVAASVAGPARHQGRGGRLGEQDRADDLGADDERRSLPRAGCGGGVEIRRPGSGADKGYDTDAIRRQIEAAGAHPTSRPRSTGAGSPASRPCSIAAAMPSSACSGGSRTFAASPAATTARPPTISLPSASPPPSATGYESGR